LNGITQTLIGYDESRLTPKPPFFICLCAYFSLPSADVIVTGQLPVAQKEKEIQSVTTASIDSPRVVLSLIRW
jgi:hypothetical protein